MSYLSSWYQSKMVKIKLKPTLVKITTKRSILLTRVSAAETQPNSTSCQKRKKVSKDLNSFTHQLQLRELIRLLKQKEWGRPLGVRRLGLWVYSSNGLAQINHHMPSTPQEAASQHWTHSTMLRNNSDQTQDRLSKVKQWILKAPSQVNQLSQPP